MIRILFNRKKCTGCGYCAEIAPSRWRMDEVDGRVVLIGGNEKNGVSTMTTTDDERIENEEAAYSCPTKTIKIQQQ